MFGLFIGRRGVVCGQFRFFVYAQGVDRVLPGQDPDTGTSQQWIPQHFPNVRTGTASFYTSNPHCCPQLTNKKLAVEVSELFGVVDRTYDAHRLVVGLERDDGHHPAAEFDNDTRLTVDVERR